MSQHALTEATPQSSSEPFGFPLLPGEGWWGGNVAQGNQMPLQAGGTFKVDLLGNNHGNQSQPIFLSSSGRVLWSEQPFALVLAGDELQITPGIAPVYLEQNGGTLRSAYAFTVEHLHRFNGQIPDPLLFTKPQFNTWIELANNQNQKQILEYARAIVAAGYAPGVLMIDNTWQEDHGQWEFSARRFPDPHAMMHELHDLGFKVILWLSPFISPDSELCKELVLSNALLFEPDEQQAVMWAVSRKHPALIRWWDGASACLDLSAPTGDSWLRCCLDRLMAEYGVDGFKFDAGDARFYHRRLGAHNSAWNANDHMESFARLAADYPYSEMRACWKLGGWPLAQRLRDKKHHWNDMKVLIPDMIMEGLLGYPYSCPDMIGGGEWGSFQKAETIDAELVVRSAQCSALMPMMQFSAAPWRVLDDKHAALCLAAADLHGEHAALILDLAQHASKTGEPIVRALGYQFPDEPELLTVNDQFLLGPDILVAPVLEQGARERLVRFPAGKWRDENGQDFFGASVATIPAPLEKLPRFRRVQ